VGEECRKRGFLKTSFPNIAQKKAICGTKIAFSPESSYEESLSFARRIKGSSKLSDSVIQTSKVNCSNLKSELLSVEK
jgi:hypothetical protein